MCGGTHAGYLSQCCLREGLYDKFCLSLEEKEYSNAKKIIAHSRSIKNELINFYGVNQDKIEVLYPPVDFSIFSRPTEEENCLGRNLASKRAQFRYFSSPQVINVRDLNF